MDFQQRIQAGPQKSKQPLSSPEGSLNVFSWRCHLWEEKMVVVSLENKELALMESKF